MHSLNQRIYNAHGWVTEHEAKEKIVQDHFSMVMKNGGRSTKDFNWEELHTEPVDLSELDQAISEKEVQEAINDMPSDKASGPDGFTDLFFKKCWDIIKHDLMRVVDRFDSMHTANLQWLNSANVVLLPKKKGRRGLATIGPLASSTRLPRS